MVARDDSVIRGSLITCIIFLVLSLALNFFLWNSANTSGLDAESAKGQLNQARGQVREMESRMDRMRSMLGFGSFTEAELAAMKENVSADAEMTAMEQQFATHMAMFGPEVEATERTYKSLPEYLSNAVRDRNSQYAIQVKSVEKIKTETDASIAAARQQQELAEQTRDDITKKMEDQSAEFDQRREEMIAEKERTQDSLNKMNQRLTALQRQAQAEKDRLQQENQQKLLTIDTQKTELNRLRATNFEHPQGKIRYVFDRGNLATINLGTADKLIPGVTFGVIDGEETRLQDAQVKATVQVTKVDGEYLSTVRVIARPEIENPIIPGDKIYSPFWAPGRVVRIALAGDIDIDGDNRPDNEALKGQIKAAGAEVAAEVSMSGDVSGKLDASIRFLVIGDDPEVSISPDTEDESEVRALEAMGKIKARAAELGLTIIPAEKLQSYLQTINDTLTTPFGSKAEYQNFPPKSNIRTGRIGIPSRIAEIYKKQTEGVQQGNKILPP